VRDVDFVNELVHDMIIVQIPKITKMSVKTRLDKLLTLFDQAQTHGSAHELSVDESSYNGDHRYVLNRLVYAKSDESVCEDMVLEDEFQTVLERWEQTETELKSRIADKDKQLASKDKQLADQQEQLAASIRLLKSLNLSDEEIAAKLGISPSEVKRY
jgi:DNA-directed RNA polymerase specialized sigma subunit